MTSKIIHYCWFGGDLPEHQKKYIEEWGKIFPDYQIKRWHEGNIPRGDEYVERVLAAKKWAFLADYIRLHALYHFGGIYMDTDVCVIRNFAHELDGVECLFGFETDITSENCYVGTAVIAAQKESPFIKSFLNRYDKKLGKMMARDDRVTGPKVLAPLLEEKGLRSSHTQNLGSIRILKREFFYPFTEEEINKSYAVHDAEGAWRTDSKSLSNKLYKKKRIFFEKITRFF